MNRVTLLILILISLSTFTNAEELFSKTGFFTNSDCAQKGSFTDCYLESYSCGYEDCFKDYEPSKRVNESFVLYVHNEGKYYDVNATNLKRSSLDRIINKNMITLFGEYNSSANTIMLHYFNKI